VSSICERYLNPYSPPSAESSLRETEGVYAALIPFATAVPCLIVGYLVWAHDPFTVRVNAGVFGIVGAILIFDIPVCLWVAGHWIVTGHPPELSLYPLMPSAQERKFHRTLRQRPQLTDEEFYQAFYARTELPPELPPALRRSMEGWLGNLKGLHPGDNLFHACDDLDWEILLEEVEQDFKVSIPRDRVSDLDGTFDSLLRVVVEYQTAEPDSERTVTQ
jgi:hypothetical protein